VALTEDQQRQCREIAGAIVKEVLEAHIKACPHGTNLKILQAKIVGVCVGCSLAGSGALFGLARIFGG
jgi:hypothetical protein